MTGFGTPVATSQRRTRKHPLAGDGPIVSRARRGLRFTAEQFGDVTSTDQTSVSVRTVDGIELELSYEPGNYVFSRVYGLTVTARLPSISGVPRGVKLVHRGTQRGGAFVAESGAAPSPGALAALNQTAARHLAGIDMVRAHVSGDGPHTLTVTPMGGAFVWVLIPPVFKATAFPPGEPERILALIRAVRDLDPTPTHSPSA